MELRRLLLGVFAVTFRATTASADVASEAAFFDALGRRAYLAGHYEQALESFQLVNELTPSDRLLYNIATCADLAGRGDMAFSLYQQYLDGHDPDTARRSKAQALAERLRAKLALVAIESDPTGATVYVDRKELGSFGVTPLTLAVSEGEHRLLLERPGFAAESVPVVARVGSLAVSHAALQALFGRLTVEVTPPSATVHFSHDGVPLPVSATEGGYRLPAGNYALLVTAPGYVAKETQVVVRANEDSRLDLGLVPLPVARGRLLVSTGRVSAALLLDGQRVAVTPATLEGIAVGKHTLEVRAAHRTSRRTVVIEKGRAKYVEFELGSREP